MVNFGDFLEMRLFWWFSTTVILQQNEIYGRAWLLYVKTQKVVILPPFTYHEEYWLKKSDGTSILYTSQCLKIIWKVSKVSFYFINVKKLLISNFTSISDPECSGGESAQIQEIDVFFQSFLYSWRSVWFLLLW